MSEGREKANVRLWHMVEAADAIIAYTQRGREEFDQDQAVRDAILYQVVVLGEAAKAGHGGFSRCPPGKCEARGG